MLHQLLVLGGVRNKNSSLPVRHIMLQGDNTLQYLA